MPEALLPPPTGFIAWVSSIGHGPDDDAATRTRKATAAMTAVITTAVVLPWTVFYWVLGIYVAAAVPTFYMITTLGLLVHLARSKNDTYLRYGQLAMFLVLPVLVHISLGGFANSSAVILFSSVVAIGGVSFAGVRRPGWWFVIYGILVFAMVPLDATVREWAPEVPADVITLFFAVNIVSTAGISFMVILFFVQARNRLTRELEIERQRSDELLRNVLPASIADRLKDGEQPIADRHDEVGVLFADIVDFTPTSEKMTANELVVGLNGVFSAFDSIVLEHGLEKVKTIGDAYMVVAGAPDPTADITDLARCAIAMREAAAASQLGDRRTLAMRFGMDLGPLIAGVIGESRLIYDVYGDTVNTASRMESEGLPGRIQVTERVAGRLSADFVVTERGIVDIKGKGPTRTFFLDGIGSA